MRVISKDKPAWQMPPWTLSLAGLPITTVIGELNQENLKATVLYRGESTPSEQLEGRLITPSERDWQDILYREPASPAFESSMSDLWALLAAMHANKFGENTMIKWILQRNRLKLRKRFERSRKDFHYGDLFDILERWSPTDRDNLRIPSKALWVLAPDRLGGFYLKYGWTVRPGVCKEIRQVTEDAEFNWLTAPDSTSLIGVLVLLGIILNQVDDLFTKTSLSVLLLPEEHAESISQAKADGWHPLTEDDCNLYGHYAVQYMKMLVSWPIAIFRLRAESCLARLVAAKIVVVPLSSPPRILDQAARERAVQSVVDETMDRMASWGPKARGVALKWIRNLAAAVPEECEPTCRIHAEAGAAALASAVLSTTRCWEPNGHLDEAFLGTADNVEICTSQRCCHLCSRLGELLEYHHDSRGFEFRLPISHDVILPWDPPLFGIPELILRRLRRELREKLVGLAVALAGQYVNYGLHGR